MQQAYELALAHGLLVHTHTNGDEVTALVLDLMDAALRKHPARDHRFTLQHCQLADAAQFRRIQSLGLCANLFANHHHYWGDQHYATTVGPERAERMNAFHTALDSGVPMASTLTRPSRPLARSSRPGALSTVSPHRGAYWARPSASRSTKRCAPSPWALPTL